MTSMPNQKHHLDEVVSAGAVLQRRREETEAAYRRDAYEKLLKRGSKSSN